MGEEIYNIDYTDENGGEGLMIFTIDKAKYKRYLVLKLKDTLDTILKKNNFYNKECTSGFNDCGSKFTDIISRNLSSTSSDFKTSESNTSIISLTKFELNGLLKKVYRARVNGFCEKDTNYDNVLLTQTEFFIIQNFLYTESTSSIEIHNNLSITLKVLFDKCGGLFNFSPYQRRSTTNSIVESSLKIDFSKLSPMAYDWIKILTFNTKRINIIEDEKKYYIYCIREK